MKMKKYLAMLLVGTMTLTAIPPYATFADEVAEQEAEVQYNDSDEDTKTSSENSESVSIAEDSAETAGATIDAKTESLDEKSIQEDTAKIQSDEASDVGEDIISYAEKIEEKINDYYDGADVEYDGTNDETIPVTGVTLTGLNTQKILYESVLEKIALPSSAKAGFTIPVIAEVQPSNATNQGLIWSSDNEEILEIEDFEDDSSSSTQFINCVSAGTATITVKTADGNKTASWTVSVQDPLSSFTITSVLNTEKGVKVTWGKSNGATGYLINRTDGNSEGEELEEINNTSYTDTEPVEYDSFYNAHKLTYEIKAFKEYTDSEIPKYVMAYGQVRYYKSANKTAITYWLNPVKVKGAKNNAKSALAVTWDKNSNSSGYQIQYSTNKNFKSAKTITVNSSKTTSKKIGKLKKNKTYYVRVRPFKTVSKTKYYGAWKKYGKGVKIKK